MKPRVRRVSAVILRFGAVLCVLALASGLQAGVILDQSALGNENLVNQNFVSWPSYNSYLVDDFTIASAATINSVTTWMLSSSLNDLSTIIGATATLNIFSEAGALPSAGNDPTSGSTVAVTYVNLGSSTDSADGAYTIYSATAAGLNIPLSAGSYWIGLTPILDYDTYYEVWQYDTSNAVAGNPAAWINPGDAFGDGASWQPANNVTAFGDAAILVDGVATPEPGTLATAAGALLALGFLRRRKA
jgi:hypothetical protein